MRAIEKDLKESSTSKLQPDTMKMLASEMEKSLENLKIEEIVKEYEATPNFIENFCTDPKSILDWKDSVERKFRRSSLQQKNRSLQGKVFPKLDLQRSLFQSSKAQC